MRSRAPIVREISWLAVIPQAAVAGSLVTACLFLLPIQAMPKRLAIGALLYLAYSHGSRLLLPRAHRRAVRLLHAQDFQGAIRRFHDSYDFFARRPWLDRYRSVLLMSPSAVSYREMALLNIAFAHSQLGDGKRAKQYYQRAVDEFPSSTLAKTALRFMDAARQAE